MTTDDETGETGETGETDDGIGDGEISLIVGQIMLDIAEAEAQDFEHRRVLTVVRNELLGIGSPLHIYERYRVVRRLGGGGMGDVYLCEDEQLHRRVAVKFVRGSGNSHDQARLRREAQTLAPLAHPNLVVVFDVGEHDGRTFLAMEYIEGQTLAQWLDDPRPWREVLARFVAAGRGLATAHRAGTVHRDFKPANVLLGQDGTVKVADFGLALVEGDSTGEAGLSTSSDLPGSRSSARSAAGTARYMSLEQMEGLGVDARSDQFAFCLALYEGIWGQPPYPDTDRNARREALSRGEPRVPHRSRGLWRVIRRGLARNPEQRWPSMDALLDALERVPRRRRQTARSVATVVLSLGLGLFIWDAPEQNKPPPEVAEIRSDIAEVRSDIVRARELRRLGQFGPAYDMAQAANASALALDDGPVQAEALAELAKAEDEAGSPSRSAELYDQAINLAEIHDLELLAAQLRIERAELSLFDLHDVEQGRAELVWAMYAYWSGGRDDGVRARLIFCRGRIAELSKDRATAQTWYREAISLASEPYNPDLPIYLDALARVASSVHDALELRRDAANFAWQRWGPHHPRTAKPMFELGLALRHAGRGGEQELETALEIWTKVYERPHPKLAKVHLLLADAALRRGELDIADEHARSMVAIQDQVLPEQHPDRGEPEQIFATTAGIREDHEAALTHARAALKFFELAGADDPGAWSMRERIVDKLLALGRLDEAAQQLVEQLRARPPDINTTMSIHLQLAELAVRRHLLDDADLQLRAVETLGGTLGEKLLIYELVRAVVDLRLGRSDPTQVERLRVALEKPVFTFEQLSTWFDELELTPRERGRLGLPK
jgi:serine/threonine protein kinase